MKKTNHRILRNYVTPAGKIPFLNWLDNIKDPVIRTRIKHRLDRMEAGNNGDWKSVGEGVFELRLAFGSGYRIYFAEKVDVIIILLCGGNKGSQQKDIKTAKLYWQDLKEQCDE